jgi:hypothetical protein
MSSHYTRRHHQDAHQLRTFATTLADWQELDSGELEDFLQSRVLAIGHLAPRLRQQAEAMLEGVRRQIQTDRELARELQSKTYHLPATVGQLRELLKGLPEDLPLGSVPGFGDCRKTLPKVRRALAGAKEVQGFQWGNSFDAMGL